MIFGFHAWVMNTFFFLCLQLYCCGVEEDGWNEYRDTSWYRHSTGRPGFSKAYVPASCCRKNQYDEFIDLEKCQKTEDGPPGSTSGRTNSALISQVCTMLRKSTAIQFRFRVKRDWFFKISQVSNRFSVFSMGKICQVILSLSESFLCMLDLVVIYIHSLITHRYSAL